LERLGVEPAFQRQFKVADGRLLERGVAEVVARIDGRALHTLCVFGDEGSEPLLGAFALDGFALAPDPIGERLTPLETLPLLFAADLATKRCVPCEGGAEPLSREAAEVYLAQVPGWRIVEGAPLTIARDVKRKDFAGAMAFVNKMAAVAEEQGHHPDFCVSWNKVKIELVTHSIGGLSENDFIMAAKINALEAGS
ncbi:MAG TPA: 4a-hydroxytetrahydrobiopterin dehydratase, partial [Candidatus Krumholzibacteria bacterium]